MKKVIDSMLGIILLFVFTACGGGNSTTAESNLTVTETNLSTTEINTTETNTTIYKLTFIDSPVANLTYSCGDKTAKTDSEGRLSCSQFPIIFSVGNIEIGRLDEMTEDGRVFPQDLAGVGREVTNNPLVRLIASFLQSLDSGGDIATAIVLPDDIEIEQVGKISEMSVAEVRELLRSLGKSMVALDDAEENLRVDGLGLDPTLAPVVYVPPYTPPTPTPAPVSRPFIITVKTDNEGVTEDNQFKIGTNAESGTYNYTVDCDGNGVNEATGVSGDYICTYDTAGTYTVKIGGEFPQIYFDLREGTYDNAKLLSIEQWGDIEWKSMEQAFIGCLNLVGNATDKPNLSNVTNMAEMFGASKFNQDIGDWDVSNIINMASMLGSTPFNQDISQWDTSKVKDMRYMFSYATSFNQDLSTWNISKVTNMTDMFKDSNLSTQNYDALLNAWSQLDLQRDVPFGAGNIEYNENAEASRQSMIDDYNWTISDGGVIE